MRNFEYFAPKTTRQAVRLLAKYQGQAKLLAGGTDLFLRMRQRVVLPEVVIDLKRIRSLAGLRYSSQKGLRIGATVTHAEVEQHPAVRRHYGALAEAASWVGSPQTRHRGTVVGNLCNASPAADTAPALIAYGATVHIAGPHGERTVPVEAFFQGPGKTVLGPDEMVVAVSLPPPQGRHGWGFSRRTRTAIDIALVSACCVAWAEGNACRDVRISLGAVAPTPLRATAAEEVLRGQRPTPERLAEAARLAAAACRPISDVRCSAAYRQETAAVLTRRCLEAAFAMLGLR
ncbi:MAG: dehydrogenase [Candidatus Tectimicrobiota bacterium]|nr:MAG: dehydrogenase [Candidatus Tectomicrobia bacterium]